MYGVTNPKMGSRRKELVAPCMGCEEKHPGCHGGCDRYKEYREGLSRLHLYEKKHEAAGEVKDPMAPSKRRYY